MNPSSPPLVFGILNLDSLTIGIPDPFSFLFSVSSTPTGISTSVGPGVVGSGAAVELRYAYG